MKQIPNIFTLINLLFGCIAITLILQNGMVATTNEDGAQLLLLPEKIYWASLFIGLAAVIDFLDGFVARLFKATSEMGKQLDSLADVVSFGVAPGLIAYQFLRIALAQQEDGLDVSIAFLIPAFLIPCAAAYRLARYNLDTSYSTNFKGVPVPAVGLLIASFPLIYWYSNENWAITLLLNKWFWYALVAAVCYLMVSKQPMMSFKFSDFSIKNNLSKIILLIVAIIAAIMLGWMAVPVVFVAYVILSVVMLPKQTQSVANEVHNSAI